ncbi:hypothetical protein A6J42_16560 [Leptospira interrogans serovar Copenhageni]|nr:hypothetical protein A6J42_16560 [Leptospira interrogans serovar Copenhageni]KAA1269418.1 hypothetical protein C5473_16895 [Leptospira interrogans serovar Weerasinghe]MCR8638630.1 hypothetical protein [Leptospira interrogans serovar Ricardi]QIP63220.1 hypothetical protein LICSK_04465 [Leptospira interrogans serovar Copenhageni]
MLSQHNAAIPSEFFKLNAALYGSQHNNRFRIPSRYLTKRFFNIHKNQIEEYVSLNLGDKRLDKRLKKIVSVMTKRGGTSLPDRFGNWSGAYRFFKSESIL